MLAHSISQRRASRFALQTQLSMAVGIALSVSALQAQAASTAQTYNEIAVNDAAVEYQSATNSVSSKAQNTKLFFECTQIESSAARLTCFDTVAQQGTTPNVLDEKQPVDLAKTIKSTISGKPQVVLAEDNVANASDNALATTSSGNNESLNTVGLTKREAQVLEEVGVTQEQVDKYTPLSLAYDLDKNSERGTWTVRPYRPNYVLPLYYTFDPNLSPDSPSQETENYTSNEVRNTDLKFQLSLKTKVAQDLFKSNADLWFGYTQQAHWQVYNEDNSRPFRSTDYQPEIFLTQPVTANLPFNGRLRMLGAGAIHHSNGRADPISRSWNRAYLMAGAEWGKLTVVPRAWLRVNNEDDSSEDNPDIEDYMGYGDIKFLYDLSNQQSLSGTLRYNPSTSKGAAQIDYYFPLSDNVNAYVQLFQGYGESIIDYNHETTAIGVGIVLNDFKGF